MKRKLLCSLGLAGLLIVPAGTARADQELAGFSAVATARGAYGEYGISGFLIVEKYIDGSGPTAQATLDSLGTSRSFASLPYPGETFVKYPGLVAVVTGQVPPGYPLYAAADYPNTPETVVGSDDGPLSLAATAGAARSHGSARAGRDGGSEASAFLNRAEAEVTRTDTVVTATAGSVARAVAIGPLSIGVIRSKAVTRLEAGASQPLTSSELSVDGGQVGTLAFTYGPAGFTVTDRGVPVPAGDGLAALNSALAPAGLAINVVAPQSVEGGQAAAVFEIVSKADVPGAGPGTFRLGFGGATAAITVGSVGAEDSETEAPGAGVPAAANSDPSPAVPSEPPATATAGGETQVSKAQAGPSPIGPSSLGAERASVAPLQLAATTESLRLGEIPSSGSVSILAAVVAALGLLALIGSVAAASRPRRTA